MEVLYFHPRLFPRTAPLFEPTLYGLYAENPQYIFQIINPVPPLSSPHRLSTPPPILQTPKTRTLVSHQHTHMANNTSPRKIDARLSLPIPQLLFFFNRSNSTVRRRLVVPRKVRGRGRGGRGDSLCRTETSLLDRNRTGHWYKYCGFAKSRPRGK